MKKLLLFVLTSLFVGGVLFAQTDESGKVKNEGNAAWRAKNYKEAFTKWEQYLKLIEFKDDATVYNVAVCANKLKDYTNAEKYFGMSIKNNYKVASSYQGMAVAQENLKKQKISWMKTARNPAVEQKLQKNESRSRIMHTFFRRKSHPSPPTQYITMRTPISPLPRVGVTVVPIHTLYMNSFVPFWKNVNLLLTTSWVLTGQVQESVRTNPL